MYEGWHYSYMDQDLYYVPATDIPVWILSCSNYNKVGDNTATEITNVLKEGWLAKVVVNEEDTFNVAAC